MKNQEYFLTAVSALPLGNIGGGEGFGRFRPDKISDVAGSLAGVISLFVGFITIAAGVWFSIKLILGAFAWISAGGNPDSLKNARQTMIDALIGIILVVGAIALISIVGTVLGLDILNLGKLLGNLTAAPSRSASSPSP